jgi:hypothetical protein
MIIQGRTMEASKERAKPAPHTRVEIVGIWRTLSQVVDKALSPANVVSIYPPLYADWPSKARCQGGILTVIAEDNKILLDSAREGTNKIRLSNSKNLAARDLLRIDSEDAYREEVLGVQNIVAGTTGEQAAWATLEWPLASSHRAGTSVQRLAPRWHESSSRELVLDAYQGDRCLFLDVLQGLSSGGYVMIATSSDRPKHAYHRLALYETESDDDGFYRLPVLQRIAQVQLRASKNGKRAEVTLQPDYRVYRNQVDFVLRTTQNSRKTEGNHA